MSAGWEVAAERKPETGCDGFSASAVVRGILLCGNRRETGSPRFYAEKENIVMNRSASKKRMQVMVTCAMLIAIQIVLVRFCSIQTPALRLSFGFLPLAMAGILFGPGYGCAVAAIADFLGATLFPTGGAFWPGFTIVTACSGLIYGLVLYEKPGANWSQRKRIFRIVLAVTIINIFVHIGLGTLNLAIMLDKGFLVLLPGRIAKNLIMIPIESACITAMHMMLVQPMTRRGMVPGAN